MFKRLVWLVVGAGFGFGMSFWVTRVVRERVARYAPDQISADLAGAVRGLGRDLRAAVEAGAEGMREKEAELRQQVQTVPWR